MTLTKEIVNVPEPSQTGYVQVKQITKILEDGVLVSQSIHRHVVTPGQDYSAESPRIRRACAAEHTTEVIAAYTAHLAVLQTADGVVIAQQTVTNATPEELPDAQVALGNAQAAKNASAQALANASAAVLAAESE